MSIPGDRESKEDNPLERGRRAAREAAWQKAFACYQEADPLLLSPADLEAMADAAWWTSRLDESLAIRQHAYREYAGIGDNRRAAYSAWFLYWDYLLFKGSTSVASGWLRRAERHLIAEPDCVEHGYLALAHSDSALRRSEFDEAIVLVERAIELGRREGAQDLVTMALQTLGRVRLAEGRVDEGIGLLDDAMCSVLAGDLHPLFTGWIYCSVLDACFNLADLKRAAEWSAAAVAWCQSQSAATPYHGLCRVYQVEVLTLLGHLADAESEGVRASEELLALEPRIACEALYTVGEIRRRRGDFTGAEAALRHAHELGRDPQPGLALIRLAQGRIEDAASLLLAAGDVTGPPLMKCRYLAAQVEVALATCDIDSARAASCKLDEVALAAPRAVLQATALTARAAVLLADEDVESALVTAVEAGAHWQELQMPFEAARTLVLCGEARRRLGQDEAARLDYEAALDAFERIGARLEVLEVAKLLSERRPQQHGLSIREVEVLRLLASGRTNRQIGAQLFVSEHTVSRHLQNIYAKIRVSSRAAATAFAYKHDLVQSGLDQSDGVFTP